MHLHLASGPLAADLDAPSVAAMLAIARGPRRARPGAAHAAAAAAHRL